MSPPAKAAAVVAPSPRERLASRIVAVGAVLIVAFVASSAFDACRLYRQSLAVIDRELASLARAIAEQTAHSFQTVDVLLRDTRDWYVAEGAALAPPRIHESLVSRAAGLPQVRGLTVVGANGMLLQSSRQFPAPVLDVSDRPYFVVQRDDPAAGLFVSEPLVSRVDGRIELVLSRRLEDRSGRFTGVVTAPVDLDDFQRFYHAIDLGAGSTITLLRPDGTLVVREPPAPAMIGTKRPDLAPVRVADAASVDASPATLIESPIDHARRFVAIVRVREFPFVLMVGRDEKVALGSWRSQAADIVVRTVAVTFLALLLIAALVRQLRRVDASERALRDIEAQLRQSQKMEAIGTLTGGIAHDFNNILGAILGYGELAQNDLAEGTSARRHVDQVMHAGGRAKVLVDRILAFGRARPHARSRVNAQAVIAETLDLLAPTLPPNVTIESELAAGNAAVAGARPRRRSQRRRPPHRPTHRSPMKSPHGSAWSAAIRRTARRSPTSANLRPIRSRERRRWRIARRGSMRKKMRGRRNLDRTRLRTPRPCRPPTREIPRTSRWRSGCGSSPIPSAPINSFRAAIPPIVQARLAARPKQRQ